jgi:tetratricopeptide (TPR) repeat protein
MAGQHDASRKEGTSVTEPFGEAEYDISVATHRFGNGRIAVFGDVNFEVETCRLVAFFCANSPEEPADLTDFLKISAAAFAAALERKQAGNTAFTAGNMEVAAEEYAAALATFGDSTGSRNQREEKVKMLSNQAECFLRLERWEIAAECATLALAIDGGHTKSRFRRAKALNEVGTSQAIQTALSDVKHILQEPDQAGRKATSKLKAEIVAKKKAFNKAAKASFAAEFASASEFHGGDSPPSSGGN